MKGVRKLLGVITAVRGSLERRNNDCNYKDNYYGDRVCR